MNETEYLRAQARTLRDLADAQHDRVIKHQLLELAGRCEDLANHMRGNGGAAASGG